MTQAQLNRSVARHTGESLCTVRSLGFHLQSGHPLDPEPEELHLAVECPHCGRRCPLPFRGDGPPVMGACVPCDLLFDYGPSDVRVAG